MFKLNKFVHSCDGFLQHSDQLHYLSQNGLC